MSPSRQRKRLSTPHGSFIRKPKKQFKHIESNKKVLRQSTRKLILPKLKTGKHFGRSIAAAVQERPAVRSNRQRREQQNKRRAAEAGG